MLSCSAVGALAVFAGTVCGHNIVSVVFLATLWAFAAGILGVLGPVVADLGLFSLTNFIVFAADPQSFHQASIFGFLALLGGLLQTGLALLFWPVRRYEPERRELKRLLLDLSKTAASPMRSKEIPLLSARVTRAQQVLSGLGRDRSLESDRYRSILNQSERIRLCLFSLSRLRKRIYRENRETKVVQTIWRFTDLTSRLLILFGQILVTGEISQTVPILLKQLDDLVQNARLETEQETRDPSFFSAVVKDAIFQMEALLGQLRAVADLTKKTTPTGSKAVSQREAEKPWWLRFSGTLATLRANLTLESVACRHAIRLSFCVGLAEIISCSFQLERSYWFPMTVAVVLKPEFSGTFNRAFLRIVGTLLGLLVATVFFHFLAPSIEVQMVLIAAFMFLLRWLGVVHYAIFAFAVSGLVVLMLAVGGVSPQKVIYARGLNTVLGGLLALIAYGIWPTWEKPLIQDVIARMLDSYRAYFQSVADICLKRKLHASNELDQVRLASRVARSNVQTAVRRLEVEPGFRKSQRFFLNTVIASSNRFVHAVMAIEAGGEQNLSQSGQEAYQSFSESVDKTLCTLSRVLRDEPLHQKEFPNLREEYEKFLRTEESFSVHHALLQTETDRMTNSLNTLREQILGWVHSEKSLPVEVQPKRD
jgi:uncharacterized membrane protein YccC